MQECNPPGIMQPMEMKKPALKSQPAFTPNHFYRHAFKNSN
jgi:hypothetical protein